MTIKSYSLALFILLSMFKALALAESGGVLNFDIVQKAAKSGDPAAQAQLGMMYREGKGTKQNENEALRWLKLASDQDHPDALYEMSRIYKGRSNYNEDEWLGMLRVAGNKGSVDAQIELASLYLRGSGVEQNETMAADWFRKAGEQGSMRAQRVLGFFYRAGTGVDIDLIKSAYWHQLAANQGDEISQTSLGAMYAYGDGVEKNPAMAMLWIRQAADSKYFIAELYLEAVDAMGSNFDNETAQAVHVYHLLNLEDPATDISELTNIAEHDNTVAEYLLGNAYASGKGADQDYEQAIRWHRSAADKGDARAQYKLGERYRRGEGVDIDFKESLRWLHLSADQGNIDAYNRIAYMYKMGEGVESDGEKTIYWYQRATDAGDISAPGSLAMMYNFGVLVAQSDDKSVYFAKIGAERGDWFSENILEKYFNDGKGFDSEESKAEHWYQLALINNFDNSGATKLKQVAERGSAKAQHLFGILCSRNDLNFHALGCTPLEAQQWIVKAARQDYPESLELLGIASTKSDKWSDSVDLPMQSKSDFIVSQWVQDEMASAFTRSSDNTSIFISEIAYSKVGEVRLYFRDVLMKGNTCTSESELTELWIFNRQGIKMTVDCVKDNDKYFYTVATPSSKEGHSFVVNLLIKSSEYIKVKTRRNTFPLSAIGFTNMWKERNKDAL